MILFIFIMYQNGRLAHQHENTHAQARGPIKNEIRRVFLHIHTRVQFRRVARTNSVGAAVVCVCVCVRSLYTLRVVVVVVVVAHHCKAFN